MTTSALCAASRDSSNVPARRVCSEIKRAAPAGTASLRRGVRHRQSLRFAIPDLYPDQIALQATFRIEVQLPGESCDLNILRIAVRTRHRDHQLTGVVTKCKQS